MIMTTVLAFATKFWRVLMVDQNETTAATRPQCAPDARPRTPLDEEPGAPSSQIDPLKAREIEAIVWLTLAVRSS
jgi:hypothetical protein